MIHIQIHISNYLHTTAELDLHFTDVVAQPWPVALKPGFHPLPELTARLNGPS